MAATPVAGIVGALAAMRDRHDSTDLLPTLASFPTLVIVGEEDRSRRPTGRRMAAAIPGARLVVIPAPVICRRSSARGDTADPRFPRWSGETFSADARSVQRCGAPKCPR